ncbi:Uncharacterized protein M6B38_248385 [Iris pallida]|uniref:Uncharacterized protein n=1 Tax=Iris pallida TaxID=29817 RepID=A0AAX6DG92_IRIPA|nr:Uncharacterized protein M6B38_248385 [Iris pallida]
MRTSVPVVIDSFSDDDEEEEYDYKLLTSDAEVERATKEEGDDSADDDCLILDEDPDKPVKVERGGGSDDDDDDLIVVEEKGQIACRDFPHSRHLCVSFPFNSTSHVKHCSLCHCYVCDSLAPCVFWGNGASLGDHCHATDKVEMWKIQRKNLKRNSVPISIPVAYPMPTQPSILNQFHPCSASSVASPVLSSRERLSQHPARSQPSTTGTQTVQREKRDPVAFSLSVKQPRTQFKRVRTPGSGLVNSSTMHSQSQYMVSYENQVVRPLPQKPHYPEAAALSRSRQQQTVISQASQHVPVTSQRSQHMPETSQRSRCTLVASQCMPVSSHPPYIPEMKTEDSIGKWQDLVASIRYDRGFSNNVIKSSTTVQPYAASSRPICNGNLIPSHINYGQQMGFHHVGTSEMFSGPVDFNGKWLNGGAVGNFTGRGEPAVQPSPAVASSWYPASAFAYHGSQGLLLPVVREESGLQGMVPSAPVYHYGRST